MAHFFWMEIWPQIVTIHAYTNHGPEKPLEKPPTHAYFPPAILQCNATCSLTTGRPPQPPRGHRFHSAPSALAPTAQSIRNLEAATQPHPGQLHTQDRSEWSCHGPPCGHIADTWTSRQPPPCSRRPRDFPSQPARSLPPRPTNAVRQKNVAFSGQFKTLLPGATAHSRPAEGMGFEPTTGFPAPEFQSSTECRKRRGF